MRCLRRWGMLTGTGSTGTIATLAIAAVAIAGLAAAPAADVGPWEAHAQSTPTTVNVGAIMANATGSDFRDDDRTAVLERAVVMFNNMYDDINLDLAVTELTRNAAVSTDEPRALLEAYDSGSGPRFYIGPTTSQGLTNINGTADTRSLLESDRVLLISPSSEAPRLAIDDNIFRLAFNVARQGDMLVEEMKSAGIASYIVVARNDAWGQDIAAHIDRKAMEEGLAKTGGPIMFEINRSAAHWMGVRDTVEANAGTVPDGGDTMGVFFLGYDDDYDDMAAAAATGSLAIRANTTWFAPSSTGIGAPSPIPNATTRDFSQAVGLTALSQDVATNDVTKGIDERLGKDATFYEYSTHDSVFVLGNAMRMAMAAGEDANDVAMVKKYIAAAAMNYTGAALGDGLLLDGNGDLRAPDSFTVHTMDRATGSWSDGRTVASTVTRVGALLAIDSADYSDNNARDALLVAAADYNAAAGRTSLVKLITYDITDPTDPSKYVVLGALTAAHGGGSGPAAYIGPSLSSNLEQVLPYATSNNILLLGYASESESLSVQGDNLFRTAISTDRHGRLMAKVMADAGVQSVVTFVRDDSWGRSLNASIAGALAQNGLQLAGAVKFAPHTAAWGPTLAEVSAAIASSTGKTGVAFVGVQTEQDSLAPAALADAAASSAQWFVTPSGFYTNTTAIADFARAVNLTAIVNDVEDSPKKAALDARVQGLNFYDYAAYDSLFILGNTIASVVESGKTSGIAADDLRPLVPAQADAYEGILGDIMLDSMGDLRSPDRFAVWQVDGTTGMWENTGDAMSTPVFDIGALLVLDNNPSYTDHLEKAAMDQAVEDFNTDHELIGDFYINLVVQRISTAPNTGSPDPDALAGLKSTYASGDGPSLYVGPSASSNAGDILNYSNANDIVLISHSSTAPSLALPDDNLFRVVAPDNLQGAILAGMIGDDGGVTDLVMAVRGDTWGREVDVTTAAGLASGTDITRVQFSESESDWPGVAARLGAAIDAASASATSKPQGRAAVLFIGFEGDFIRIAAQASSVPSLSSVNWFGPNGVGNSQAVASNATSLAFARDVGMTTVIFTVLDNDVNTRLDPTAAYGPSAYDTVRIMGDAIKAAYVDGSGTVPPALDVKAAIPAAAAAYTGALGDVMLDANGDLSSPNTYGVYMISEAADAWVLDRVYSTDMDGARTSIPVARVGALLAIDSADYPDNNARDALMQATRDYNAAAGDPSFILRLTSYDITNPADPNGYAALDVLKRAHANGSGPSVYIGPSLSSNIEDGVLEYANNNNNDILLLGYASEAESLSIPGDNLFRTAISTDRHGHFMAQVMADAGVQSVVTVVRDDAWGRSLSSSITEALVPNGLMLAGAVSFAPGTSADWSSTLDGISAAIAGSAGSTGVVFVGVASEQDALAEAIAAAGNTAATGVPWFVTASGQYEDMPAATRDFARSVGMTAVILDVEESAKRSALDERVGPGLNFYDYAAYDGLFILGDSIAAAATGSGKAVSDINATDLRPVVPRQADAYEGILGDIVLNSKGDLRSPDRFAVWQVDGATGMWTNTGVTKSTPVIDVGAIVILESDRFDDSPRLEAMRIAVDDYNRAAEDGGALYLNLRVVQTSLSPGAATSTSPAATDAVMATSGGEDGITYYVGPSTSGNSQRVLGYANANNLTMISPSSTAPSLAVEGDALFRLVPNDSQQGKVLADIVHNQQGALLAALIDQTGHEHVVMVVRNDTWGLGLDASTSARLAGVHNVDITRIVHDESDADWSQTAMDIETEIARVRSTTPNDPIAVLHIGFPGDFVSLAARASDNSSMRTVPWFGTDGVAGSALILRNDTARQFADAVNLTATKFDVVANDKFDSLTAALESRGVAVRTTYEYSAYDSVFVLGRAIEAAISAKGVSYEPLDVRSSVRAAAADYEGALGDIELNKAGDLRTPNSYATWTIDAAINGSAWTKVDTHPSTPVFDIGALLMLDNNPIYTDDREKAAMDQAVDDFNTDHELIGDFYINLAVQRINIAPNTGSPDPDALTGLMDIHANGAGPSLYVGPSTSGNSQRVLGYANANGIVLISHSSTAPSLAICGDNLFRMVAPDNRQGGILADLIGSDGGVTDLVMAVRGDTWGRGVDETTTAGLASGTDITRISFAESEADWPGVATRLGAAIDAASASAAAKPQGRAAVLFIGFDGDFNGVASQASSVPSLSSVNWFGPDGVGNSQAVISNATSLAFAKSVDMTTVIFTVQDNAVKATLDPAAVYGPSAYDTVRVMGDAIKAAYTAGSGAVPPALDVKAAIPAAAAAYTGALGNVTLDANGDLLSPSSYGIYRIGAGDAWELVRVQEVSGEAGTCGIRYITIGEMFSPQAATIGSINDAVHKAYVLAVEDYNREREAENSPLRIQLQRVDLSVTLPTRGVDGSAPAPNSRPSWDLGGVIAAYAGGSGPAAYLGPISTSAARPLAGLAAENGLVMVSPTIASADLTARDNMFRLSLSDKHEADLITIAAQREGVETILPVLTTSTGQSSYGDEIRIEAEILGMTYLDPVYIPFTFAELNLSSTVAELNTTVAGLQSAGTDLSSVGIITEGPHKDFQSLARYAVEYPLLTSVKWFVTTGIDPPHPIADSETLRLAESGLLYSLSWDIPQTDRLERVRDTLAQREGYPPNKYSYAAYDAVYLLADAIRMTMAMSPDGTYTGADVASNMHVAADRLDGLLGDNMRLGENGGRILPNTAVIWKTTSEGAWEDTTDRADLDPVCSIWIKEDTLAFGSVRAGVPSNPAAQTIRDVGTLTVSSMDIDATEWTNSDGAVVLGKGATKVMIGSGAWTSLANPIPVMPETVQTDAMFRLDVPSDLQQSRAGYAEQDIEYIASCDP